MAPTPECGEESRSQEGCRAVISEVLLLHRAASQSTKAILYSGWEASHVVALPLTTTRWCSSLDHLVIHNCKQVQWFLHLSCRTASAEGPADPPLTRREGDDFP